VALNIISVIIAVYFQTHKNVYQCTCMEQKTTAVYRDVGLLYRMWFRSPFWRVDFGGSTKFLET